MNKFYQIYVGGEFLETEFLLAAINPYNDIPADLPSWQYHNVFMQITSVMHEAKISLRKTLMRKFTNSAMAIPW